MTMVPAPITAPTLVTPVFMAIVATLIAPIVAPLVANLVTTLLAEVAAVIVAAVIVAMAIVALTVDRRIFPLIPLVADEIDTFAAGAIAMAVLVPVLGVAGGHAQIERRALIRHGLDDHRLGI